MSSRKILVTGGAGFIGGSVIAELLKASVVPASNIIAILRKQEHADKIAKNLGVDTVVGDIGDGPFIEKIVLEKDVDVVIHNASSGDFALASPLLEALGKQKEKTGRPVYFIHTSGTSSLADVTGWKTGVVSDTDPIYEQEKTLEPYWFRDVNIAVYEKSKELGIQLHIVIVPYIYGEGLGEFGRLTVYTPILLRAYLKRKAVLGFPDGVGNPAAHVSNVANFFGLLAGALISPNPPAAGYWFPSAHNSSHAKMEKAYGKALHARGLIDSPEPLTWSSEEEAAEDLAIPAMFVPLIFKSTVKLNPVRAERELGWKPTWDEERFMGSMDEEIESFFRNGGNNAKVVA